MIRVNVAAPLIAALALSGCASSLSGVGGTQNYACKAPEGALCTSISGVFANSVQGTARPTAFPTNQPANKPPAARPAAASAATFAAESATSRATPLVPSRSTTPSVPDRPAMRANARVLRVWIAPWEDTDGDLHEDAFVHVLVDTGRWLIEHVRPASRSRMESVAPPIASVQDSAPPKAPSDAPLPADQFPPPAAPMPSDPDTTPIER
jgi:conjugal transfer pilus assembly protein TraV